MNNWFECKVSYEKVSGVGLQKKVSESYLIQGETHASVEERLMRELSDCISLGELTIDTIKRVKIAGLYLSDNPEDYRYYKSKVLFISLDEQRGMERRMTTTMIVQSDSVLNAVTRLEDDLSSSIAPYEIISIAECNIVAVLPWVAD